MAISKQTIGLPILAKLVGVARPLCRYIEAQGSGSTDIGNE
jgi:hypothetical protein